MFLVFCIILQCKIVKQHEVNFFLLWLNYFFRKINRLKIGKKCVRCIMYAFILFPFYFDYLCIADAWQVDVYSDFLQCYIQTFFSCWIFLYIFSKRGKDDYQVPWLLRLDEIGHVYLRVVSMSMYLIKVVYSCVIIIAWYFSSFWMLKNMLSTSIVINV